MRRLYEWFGEKAGDFASGHFSDLIEEPAGPELRLALAAAHRLFPSISYRNRDAAPYGRVLFLLSRHDIEEVLDRDDVFSVSGYDARMKATSGRFFLGMDASVKAYAPEERSAAHALGKQPGQERSSAEVAFRRGDIDRIKGVIDRAARDAVGAARGAGKNRIDASKGLADRVVMALMGDYFGIREMNGPDGKPMPGAFIDNARKVSYYVFNFFASGPDYAEPATRAGGKVHAHLASLARAAAGDTVIARMATNRAAFATPDDVARTVGGVALGGIVPGLGTTLHSIARLVELSGPPRKRLERAAEEHDLKTVFRFAREGARFAPYPPTIFRTCNADYTLAAGTVRERRVEKGTVVVPLFVGAAFDPDFVHLPDSFIWDRPDTEYLLFGHGQHECLGTYIGEQLLAHTVCELFKIPGLRRVKTKGATHPKSKFAPYGDELLLQFDV